MVQNILIIILETVGVKKRLTMGVYHDSRKHLCNDLNNDLVPLPHPTTPHHQENKKKWL